jgi:hypothetical protein
MKKTSDASSYRTSLRELRQVKNTALLIKQANSGKDLTYDEYVQLLTHTASNYDNGQIKAKGKRQVYIHDINDDKRLR